MILEKDFSPFELSPCQEKDSVEAPDCSKGVTRPGQKLALIGDSKMGQYAQPLIDYFTARGWKVHPLVMAGCHIANPQNTNKANCSKRSDWIIKELLVQKL
jgi:hypothetical protein